MVTVWLPMLLLDAFILVMVILFPSIAHGGFSMMVEEGVSVGHSVGGVSYDGIIT